MEVNLPLLISASELNSLLEESNDQFDVKYRIVEVHMNQNGLAEYSKGHIKKAIFVNMMHEVVQSELYPFDIPQVESFEQYLGSLGIGNKHHIIIYDRSDLGYGFSPRMWSVLRLFGHEKISILKGGFNSWKNGQFSTSLENPSFQPEKFEINVNYNLLRYYEQIRKNLKSEHEIILDARPEEDFNKNKDGEKINHIPKAINVPFSDLLDADGIKSRSELDAVFRARGVNLRRRLITSCNTGVKACVLQLALYLVGVETVPVYYGSWTEYSKKDEEESKYNFKPFGPEETKKNQSSSICVLL